MRSRRKFSAKYKREAVAMLESLGVSTGQIATKPGIGANVLGRGGGSCAESRARRFEAMAARPFPNRMMCQGVQVSPNGCYGWAARPPSAQAQEIYQPPSHSLLREQRKLLTPLRLIFSRRIRRHEHKYFEAMVCVIFHAMLFPSRRHGPLPRTEHLLL